VSFQFFQKITQIVMANENCNPLLRQKGGRRKVAHAIAMFVSMDKLCKSENPMLITRLNRD
jgi:hypothetical protein